MMNLVERLRMKPTMPNEPEEAADRIEELERAIDEQMVSAHLGTFESTDNPSDMLHSLMMWSQSVGEFFAQERIKELEAKLKIAVEALEYYTWDGWTTIDNAVEALTKIKGDV